MKSLMSVASASQRSSLPLSGRNRLPFRYVRLVPDEEVTAFSVCDISPPQFSNRDRFAENTTVFEISDLKVVTMICVGAQIMSDYDRLM